MRRKRISRRTRLALMAIVVAAASILYLGFRQVVPAGLNWRSWIPFLIATDVGRIELPSDRTIEVYVSDSRGGGAYWITFVESRGLLGRVVRWIGWTDEDSEMPRYEVLDGRTIRVWSIDWDPSIPAWQRPVRPEVVVLPE